MLLKFLASAIGGGGCVEERFLRLQFHRDHPSENEDGKTEG